MRQTKRDLIDLLRKDKIICERFAVHKKIGQGSFGEIFEVTNLEKGRSAALKVVRSQNLKSELTVDNEIRALNALQGLDGIPKLYSSGEWNNGAYIEMELLDKDLGSSENFKLQQIIQVTLQLLILLESVHSLDIIHQDLKPQNIMLRNTNQYCLIDFGLAQKLQQKTATNCFRSFVGTPRYASLRAHSMLQQSKKDDLESLFYIIAYLYYRQLPWTKLIVPKEYKLQKIKQLKIKHRKDLFDKMCPAFKYAFDYITRLENLQEPNYAHLKAFFGKRKTVIARLSPFDDTPKHQRRKQRLLTMKPLQNMILSRTAVDVIDQNIKTSKSSLDHKGKNNFSERSMFEDIECSNWTSDGAELSEKSVLSRPLRNVSNYANGLILKNPFQI